MWLINKRITDFFFPRICHVCGGRLSLSEEEVCLGCLTCLPRTALSKNTDRNEVKNLYELKIPIKRAGAFMRYLPEEDSAKIVKSIKYHNAIALAHTMGRMMAEEFSQSSPNIFTGIDLIIPTPLTKSRQRKRGYNQAEELAKGITEVVDIPIDTTSVIRKRFNASQTTLSHDKRSENVRNAFHCVRPDSLNGKHLLLVDDVITTGATILALADSIAAECENVTFSVLSLCITGELKHI